MYSLCLASTSVNTLSDLDLRIFGILVLLLILMNIFLLLYSQFWRAFSATASEKTFEKMFEECATCGGSSRVIYSRINRREAEEKPDSKAAKQLVGLHFVRDLKFGKLYECPLCHNWWHMDSESVWIFRVPEERREMLVEWDRSPLIPEERFRDVLREIGATGPHHYTLRSTKRLHIPCEIEWGDGTVTSRCVLILTDEAPIDVYEQGRLMQGVRDIRKSPFTLPQDVRLESTTTEELRMDYCPTFVCTTDGEILWLNWQAFFLEWNGKKGSDFRLFGTRQTAANRLIVKTQRVEDPVQPVFVYADRFDGCDELLIRDATSV